MAQIIKHRRGTAAQLKTVTLQKGELGVSTGSVSGLETPILHVGDGANAAGHVVGRLHQGATVPTLNSGDIGSSLNNLLFHDSATYKLVRLHTDGNETLNLTDNVADFPITGSLITSGNISGSAVSTGSFGYVNVAGDISASGNIHAVGNITFEGGSGGTITLGSAADDNVVFSGDVNSNIVPNTDNTFDLGSTSQQWRDIYAKGVISGSTISGSFFGSGAGLTGVSATGLDIDGLDAGTAVHQTEDHLIFSDNGTEKKITFSDFEDQIFSNINAASTHIAIAAGGAITIENTQVTDAMLNDDVAAGLAGAGSTASSGVINVIGGDGITVGASEVEVTVDNVTVELSGTDGSGAVRIKDAGVNENKLNSSVAGNGLTGGGGSALAVGAGTGVTVNANDIAIGQDVGTSDNVTFANITATGNLVVAGSTTYVSSSTVDIGDNIIVLNALNGVKDGGIQVIDVSGSSTGSNPNPTGSFLWNAADDYWYSGISGSTHYRIPQQAAGSNLTDNKILISDANGRIESSANITDDGTTVDFNDVDLTSVDMIQGVDANVHIDLGTSDLVETKGNIVPNTHNEDDLGSSSKKFKDFYLEGNADIEGNIDVNGTSNLDNTDIDGTLDVSGIADFQSGVDLQSGVTVTGSIFVDSGASVEATGSSAGSYIAFRNQSNTQLGYLAPTIGTTVISGVIGYNEDKELAISNIIDGGSF